MTKQEAIEHLRGLMSDISDRTYQALKIVIDALEGTDEYTVDFGRTVQPFTTFDDLREDAVLHRRDGKTIANFCFKILPDNKKDRYSIEIDDGFFHYFEGGNYYDYKQDGFDIIGVSYPSKPKTKTVAWEFEDYLEHAECWYRRDGSNRISKIQDFDYSDLTLFITDIWYTMPNADDIRFRRSASDLMYSPTPNGEFKPCVKEVEG